MTAAAALIALLAGGLSWEEDAIAGLWSGEAHRLSGSMQTNFRHADIDGDGAPDLVLPDKVLVQRGGRFPAEAGQPIPGAASSPLADVWDDALYLLHRDGAVVCVWENGELKEGRRYGAAWPQSFLSAEFDGLDSGGRGAARRRRYLIDLNGDGAPEIVAPVQLGVAVFGFSDGAVVERGRLDVFPPARVTLPPDRPLWPAAERAVALPSRHMSCLYTVEEGAILTIEERGAGAEPTSVYAITRHLFTLDGGQVLTRGAAEFVREVRAPRWAQPCRLNDDGVVDFAGGRTYFSDTTAIAMPLYETYVDTGTDAGAQTFRSRFLEPHCLFTDINGDGRLDMIAEHTRLFEGGLQDTLVRTMTSRTIDHTVAIHLQAEDGRFPAAADMAVSCTIRLDSAAYKSGPMMSRYRDGRLVNALGDFNGDGLRDLAIQDAPDRIAIWLNAGGRFVLQPETGPGRRDAGFAVTDVDGDGRSDIVFSPAAAGGTATVYFTRDAGT